MLGVVVSSTFAKVHKAWSNSTIIRAYPSASSSNNWLTVYHRIAIPISIPLSFVKCAINSILTKIIKRLETSAVSAIPSPSISKASCFSLKVPYLRSLGHHPHHSHAKKSIHQLRQHQDTFINIGLITKLIPIIYACSIKSYRSIYYWIPIKIYYKGADLY